MRDKNKVTKRQGWTDYIQDGMTRVRNERRERERERESAHSQAPLACESGRVAAYLPVQEQEEEEGALGDVVL